MTYPIPVTVTIGGAQIPGHVIGRMPSGLLRVSHKPDDLGLPPMFNASGKPLAYGPCVFREYSPEKVSEI